MGPKQGYNTGKFERPLLNIVQEKACVNVIVKLRKMLIVSI